MENHSEPCLPGSTELRLFSLGDADRHTANQHSHVWPFTPSRVVNTNNSLIAAGAQHGGGKFQPGAAGRSVNGLTVNTDLQLRIIQPSTSTDTNYASAARTRFGDCLHAPAGPANGYSLTNITVLGGWLIMAATLAFTVLYSTVANPANFLYLTTVNHNPTVPGNTASANQAIINDSLR
jgi:hypothetical protein